MKILILSKTEFDNIMLRYNITNENVQDKTDMFFISINDTCNTKQIPYFKNNHENVLIQYFDDVVKDIIDNNNEILAKAFTEEQAIEMFKFIEKNKDKKTCLVHCTAGISRSAAVGTFICDFTNGNYFEFKEDNPYILPNPHISKTLNYILLKEKYDL
jgi:predicted protein tyrosine phosphatase